MKKTRNILVSLLACLFVILAVPTAVSAAAKAPQCPKKQTLEFYNAYISGALYKNIYERCCNFPLLEVKCDEYNKEKVLI